MDGVSHKTTDYKSDDTLLEYLSHLSVAERLRLNDTSMNTALRLKRSFQQEKMKDNESLP